VAFPGSAVFHVKHAHTRGLVSRERAQLVWRRQGHLRGASRSPTTPRWFKSTAFTGRWQPRGAPIWEGRSLTWFGHVSRETAARTRGALSHDAASVRRRAHPAWRTSASRRRRTHEGWRQVTSSSACRRPFGRRCGVEATAPVPRTAWPSCRTSDERCRPGRDDRLRADFSLGENHLEHPCSSAPATQPTP
jgi:hypothetical protein